MVEKFPPSSHCQDSTVRALRISAALRLATPCFDSSRVKTDRQVAEIAIKIKILLFKRLTSKIKSLLLFTVVLLCNVSLSSTLKETCVL